MTLKQLIGASVLLTFAVGQSSIGQQYVAGPQHVAGPPAPCQSCQSCQQQCAGYQPHLEGFRPCADCTEGMPLECPPHPFEPSRPTPPPCCADGLCYPNPATWGHYATRWRHWPIDYAAAGAGVRPPIQADVPPYVLPTPEEEDRRAPPPTTPREEPPMRRPTAPTPVDDVPLPDDEGEAPTDTGAVPTSPFAPRTEETPSASPFEAPTDESPSTAPLTPPQGTPSDDDLFGPTGDADPPPALPFQSPTIGARPEVRSAAGPAANPHRKPDRAAQSDDPPPALPLALAR